MEARCQSLSAAEQKFAADIRSVETSNDKMKELNADLDTVLDRLQQILTNNFAMDGKYSHLSRYSPLLNKDPTRLTPECRAMVRGEAGDQKNFVSLFPPASSF